MSKEHISSSEQDVEITVVRKYDDGIGYVVDGELLVKVEFREMRLSNPHITLESLYLEESDYGIIKSELVCGHNETNSFTRYGKLKIPPVSNLSIEDYTIYVYDNDIYGDVPIGSKDVRVDIVGVVSVDPVTEIVHKDGSEKYNKVENLDYVSELLSIPVITPIDTSGYIKFTKHDHTIMELVDSLANKSTCERAKMGAVIVIDDGIFITGYNGTLKGFPNNCDDISLVCTLCNVAVDPSDYNEGEQHCKKGYIEKRPKSNLNVVHAEVNAIYKAAKHGISIINRPMYMTTSPCVNCANAIVQAGISRVIYKHDHDDLRGLETLRKAGIDVIKYIKG